LLLDAGRAQGVTRAELVVDGSGPVLDAGTTSGVAIGDRVLSGAIVIGRVERTARWVSAVQPVTADGFRAQATLLRVGPGGRHFGATGILEGTGEAQGRLTGIPHTEAVAVGDDVVTADVSGVRGPRLYFGKVVKADFLAGGQWDIRIQPAADADSLDEVAILRLNVTPSVRTSTATNASATRTAAANDRSTP
jgi:cell shape-determining protein MreC